jgi:type IV secretory pathway VirB2 component (pilin)
MNPALMMLLSNAVSIAAVITAGILAAEGKEGWGWFLFIAVLCFTTFETRQ